MNMQCQCINDRRVFLQIRTAENKWTKDEIIRLIHQRVNDGLPINVRAVDSENPSLVIAARRKFGSWSKALVAAGYDLNSVTYPNKKWTPEAVIEAIRNRAKEGKSLNYSAFELENTYLRKVAQRAFGSWSKAFEIAGVQKPENPTKWTKKWTKESIVYTLQELYRNGQPLKMSGALRLAIYREFGSLQQAYISAGIPNPPKRINREKWTEETVIRAIRDVSSSGKVPTSEALKREGKSRIVRQAVKVFGSWNKAVLAAGFTPINQHARKWTEETVIKAIRDVSSSGKAPTSEVLKREGKGRIVQAAVKVFGSWNAAILAAGFTPINQYARKWTEETVIQAIRDVSSSGKVPSSEVLKKEGKETIFRAAVSVFGSWKAAVLAAGFTPINQYVRKWTEETVIQAIRDLSSSGKVPSSNALRKEGKGEIVRAAVKVFGSWNKAILAAGFTPNKIRINTTTR
jgi:hypothetical protein